MPNTTVQTFLTRPQNVRLRKSLFQIHFWSGLAICLYIFAVSITGAVLVFRLDLQRASFPHLFVTTGGAPADAVTVLEKIADAFPGRRIYGIEAPTRDRPTTLAYVESPDRGSLSLLLDPATLRILGQLPERSILTTLHNLHSNLLGGRIGRLVNAIVSLLLLLMCATGLVIWWPGLGSWRSGFVVNLSRSWRRVNWELHGAVGVWAIALIAVWAVTGIFFAAPSQVQSVVNAISPLTTTVTPTSNPAAATASRPGTRELIARAQERVPDQYVFRVMPPQNATGAVVVAFSPTLPAPVGPGRLTNVYLDQYTGDVLKTSAPADRSIGDRLIDWASPLHIGNFGGIGVRIAWFVLGLAPAVLAVTGFIMWWLRVIRPRWQRA